MAVKHLTYKSIPQKKREKAAARAAAELKGSLNQSLSEEQRAKHLDRLDRIRKWASGTLQEEDTKKDPEPKTRGQNHRVSVSETLTVKED